jgi:hypothetical protein
VAVTILRDEPRAEHGAIVEEGCHGADAENRHVRSERTNLIAHHRG